MTTKARKFSLPRYVDAALALAEYDCDENGIVMAVVPDASGFFARGDTLEEARTNLRNVIKGNVRLALQQGVPLPAVPSEMV